MKTREEILKLWGDPELCEDFTPILEELLDDRDDVSKAVRLIDHHILMTGVKNIGSLISALKLLRGDKECKHRRTKRVGNFVKCLDCEVEF